MTGWQASEQLFPTAKPLSPHTQTVDSRQFMVETEEKELVCGWQDAKQ